MVEDTLWMQKILKLDFLFLHHHQFAVYVDKINWLQRDLNSKLVVQSLDTLGARPSHVLWNEFRLIAPEAVDRTVGGAWPASCPLDLCSSGLVKGSQAVRELQDWLSYIVNASLRAICPGGSYHLLPSKNIFCCTC